MTYIEFIRSQLQDYSPGQPIYSVQISADLATHFGLSPKEAAVSASAALRRILDKGYEPLLRRYKRGIYYLTVITPVGELGIDRGRLVADKYLLPDEGYETDYSELYRLGLTTWIPRYRYFASNKVSRSRMDEQLGVLIRPPRTRIDSGNKKELQFLDVLTLMNRAPVDADNPWALLANYVKKRKLKYEHLLSLARRYYDRDTIWQLGAVACKGEL